MRAAADLEPQLLAGSSLGTAAKMEVISLVNGFAIMYGGLEATLAAQQASTGVTPDDHVAGQVSAMIRAAPAGSTRTWPRL